MSAEVTHYFAAEGLVGEGSVWRVVRAEVSARGLPVYAYVASCQTLRAALSMAGALNKVRDVSPDALAAAARLRAGLQAVPDAFTR